tara:strand:- start:2592 stop:3452 length:861 start_codon:yes stop_codon:yes gene_type:complete
MQIMNNVQESTTTTGTGNITLAGASEDGNTFTSGYLTDQRFPYLIDDGAGSRESGIGYLSASTTLVRETPLSSTNGDALVNFAAGTKQVFVSATAEISASSAQGQSLTGTLDYKIVKSSHYTRSSNGTASTVGTRVYFVPFLLDYSGKYDALTSVVRTTGGAGDIFLGLYTRGLDGLPDMRLLTNATSLDPTVSGIQYGTFTEQSLPLGWYFMAFTCDVNVTVSSIGTATYTLPPHLGVDDTSLFDLQGFYYIDGSLTVLPAIVGARSWTAVSTSAVPFVGLRPTT